MNATWVISKFNQSAGLQFSTCPDKPERHGSNNGSIRRYNYLTFLDP
jgi:hypothetical protein